jgi:hypothetical protein
MEKGNPYHKKVGKEGGQFTSQTGEGAATAKSKKSPAIDAQLKKWAKRKAQRPLKNPEDGGARESRVARMNTPKGDMALEAEAVRREDEAAAAEREAAAHEKDKAYMAAREGAGLPESQAAGIKMVRAAEVKRLQREDEEDPSSRPNRDAKALEDWAANDPTERMMRGVRQGAGLPERAANKAVMKRGQSVEFVKPNSDEGAFPMVVLEDRGDRLLVEDQVPNMPIKPTRNVLKSDVKVAGRKPPLVGKTGMSGGGQVGGELRAADADSYVSAHLEDYVSNSGVFIPDRLAGHLRNIGFKDEKEIGLAVRRAQAKAAGLMAARKTRWGRVQATIPTRKRNSGG